MLAMSSAHGQRSELLRSSIQNRWLIDRGNGQPSVNLVILSFVNPLKLLNKPPMPERLMAFPWHDE